MTPGELELMRKYILEAVGEAVPVAVAAAVAPIRRDVEALQQTDKRHSGIHRDLHSGVRQSRSEMGQRVDDTVTALAVRDAHLAGALNGIRDEMALARVASLVEVEKNGTRSMVPAAPLAAKAAANAEGTSAATQVAADRADKSASQAERWSKLGPVIQTFVLAILAGVWKFAEWLSTHGGASP